jgi:hypothetical protein
MDEKNYFIRVISSLSMINSTRQQRHFALQQTHEEKSIDGFHLKLEVCFTD